MDSGQVRTSSQNFSDEFGRGLTRVRDRFETLSERVTPMSAAPRRKKKIKGCGHRSSGRPSYQHWVPQQTTKLATKTEERSGIETVAHKNNVLNNWCKEIGRDPSEIKRSIGIDIKRIDLADELIEAGATEVTLAVNGPGYDLTDVKEWIAWRDSKN